MGKGPGVGVSSLFSCCIAAEELRISVRLCCHKLRSIKHTETKRQGKKSEILEPQVRAPRGFPGRAHSFSGGVEPGAKSTLEQEEFRVTLTMGQSPKSTVGNPATSRGSSRLGEKPRFQRDSRVGSPEHPSPEETRSSFCGQLLGDHLDPPRPC